MYYIQVQFYSTSFNQYSKSFTTSHLLINTCIFSTVVNMIRTAVNAASSAKRSTRSLALNVHFKHPDLGMKDYEILSRASAFLLSVDPASDIQSNNNPEKESPYSHIAKSQQERERLIHKQNYSPEPAGGPKRHVKDLSWLEFCPGKHRPLTHVVTASHVLSPWLWKDYYPQPWLSVVTQEHVRYSIDVFDNSDTAVDSASSKREPLATFALNPYPIHHPSELDLAIVHLKQEETALKHLKALGVEMMYLRDNETLFDKGDEVVFDGYELADEHYAYMENMNKAMEEKNKAKVRAIELYDGILVNVPGLASLSVSQSVSQ